MDPIRSTDDPRLTAYALNELPADEVAAVEAFLAEHPEARDAVEATRALGASLAADLEQELAAGATPGLAPAQRAAIAAAARGAPRDAPGDAEAAADPAQATRPVAARAPRRLGAWRPLAAAAVVLVTFVLAFGVFPALVDGPRGPLADLLGLGEGRVDDERAPAGDDAVAGGPGAAGSEPGAQQLAPSAPAVRGDGVAHRIAPRRQGDTAVTREDLGFRTPNAQEWRQLEALGYLGDAGDDGETDTLRGDPAAKVLSLGRSAGSSDGPQEQADDLSAARYARDHVGPPTPRPGAAGEGYAPLQHNPFVTLVPGEPLTALSTFGVDVDRASYANVRRFLQRNELPPPAAVRLEELVNAFSWSDPPPADDAPAPFAVHTSVAPAPWAPDHLLARIALRGRVVEAAARPPTRLVFLVDVSGSMQSVDKLPLLKQSLRLLVEQLDARDEVALVTYAGDTRVALPATPGTQKAAILAAIDALGAGGSTHGSAGLQLAYATVEQDLAPDDERVRRVILCTDGDFNVGVTSQEGLHALIAERAAAGTALTVLGFGTGNYQDATAETLADRGNGHYAYIDGLDEAHRVLVRQLTGTLVTIAQDVKLQVEFNPARVSAWRQLGYENRALAARDFRDDRKDAGEIGAGHSVVAYYEIVPAGAPWPAGTAELRYQQAPEPAPVDPDAELLTVNLRWKRPGAAPADPAREFAVPFAGHVERPFAEQSDDFRFGAAVLAFGMALRRSPHAGDLPLSAVHAIARAARGVDPEGERAAFADLVLRAQGLLPRADAALDAAARERLEALGYLGDPGDDR